LQNFSSFARKGISSSDTLPRRTAKAFGRRLGKSSEDWDNTDILFIPWNAIVIFSKQIESCCVYCLCLCNLYKTQNKAAEYICNAKSDNGFVQCPYINNLSEKSVPTNTTFQKAPLGSVDTGLQHHSRMHIMPLLLVPRDDRNELRVHYMMH
jgi:hypothetical protein